MFTKHPEDDSILVHDKQEVIRAKVAKKSAQASNAGKKSASVKYDRPKGLSFAEIQEKQKSTVVLDYSVNDSYKTQVMDTENTAMQNAIGVSIKTKITEELLSQFNAHLIIKKQVHSNIDKYVEHFIFWHMRRYPPNSPNDNITSNEQRKTHRRTNLESISSAADEILLSDFPEE